MSLTFAGFQVSILIQSILFLVRVDFCVSFYRTRLAVERGESCLSVQRYYFIYVKLSRLSAGRKAWPS